MKIAIVGKGGSGKSTISWLLTKYLMEKGKKVLGIDADYNMDYISNLGISEKQIKPFLNESEKDFYKYLGLTDKDYYIDIPNKENLKTFSLNEKDEFTEKYSLTINKNLSVMAFGNHNEELLFGHRCSHAYISPLKYYLPLLKLKNNEVVIIDSVAGIDMVAYGLYLGVDCIIIIVNDTDNSFKVATAQIGVIAERFNIPSYYLLNINTSTKSNKKEKREIKYISKIKYEEALLNNNYGRICEKNKKEIEILYNKLEEENFKEELQWERHINWNKEYLNQLEITKEKDFNFLPK